MCFLYNSLTIKGKEKGRIGVIFPAQEEEARHGIHGLDCES